MKIEELKAKLLDLLESDIEFRYAVAGKLGILELLKRLDSIESLQAKILDEIKSLRENQEKLWRNQEKLWQNQNKLWEEVKALRENQEKLWKNQEKLWENQEKLWREVKGLREEQEKLWEEVKNLREGQERLWENQERLWRGQERLWEEVKELRKTQNIIATTLHRLTITIEEESLDVIKHRLKSDLGLDIVLSRIFVDDREINIYGATSDICIIGESTVRLGLGPIDELEEKIDFIKHRRPELLRRKLIKVIYTDYAIPSALEEAKRRGIWVLKWSGDLTPMTIIEQ